MPRKRISKSPTKKLNSSSALLNETIEESQPIEEEQEEEKSFSQRATEKLNSIMDENSPVKRERDFDSLSPGGKWKRLHKRERGRPAKSGAQEEMTLLFSSVLVLIFAFSKLPEETHPSTERINSVSFRLSRILLRHVDISGKLTGDVLDIIAIFIEGSAWYAEVSPALKQLAAQKEKVATPPAGLDEGIAVSENPIPDTRRALAQTLSELDGQNGLN